MSTTVTSKGQVTIPQTIRDRIGLLPNTEVEFEIVDDWVRLRKAQRRPGQQTRGRAAIAALHGTATSRMTTDEILALTRE